MTLHPAGHILGSAQCLLAHDHHGTLLYTGDFKLPRGSAEPCATPHADVLIMETTFGLPRYVFPPANRCWRRSRVSAARRSPTASRQFSTPTASAKARNCCTGSPRQLPVMLHPQAFKLTRIYEELGLAFPSYRLFETESAAGHVVICPPLSDRSAFFRPCPSAARPPSPAGRSIPGPFTATSAMRPSHSPTTPTFPIFWRSSTAFSRGSSITLHGYAQEFARTLRARGLEAWALGADNQLELGLAEG